MNTVAAIMNEVATTAGIASADLTLRFARDGWDLSVMDAAMGTAGVPEFVRTTAANYAADIAKVVAVKARAEANRLASQTPAARANPQFACTRCDGKGRIRGFEHRANGVCYACGGKGVWQPRRRRG